MLFFRTFHLFKLVPHLRTKARKRWRFLDYWKPRVFFVKLSKTLPKHDRTMIWTVLTPVQATYGNFHELLPHVTFTASCPDSTFWKCCICRNISDLQKQHLVHLFVFNITLFKFSIVSVFSDWLYNLKRKFENAGKF